MSEQRFNDDSNPTLGQPNSSLAVSYYYPSYYSYSLPVQEAYNPIYPYPAYVVYDPNFSGYPYLDSPENSVVIVSVNDDYNSYPDCLVAYSQENPIVQSCDNDDSLEKQIAALSTAHTANIAKAELIAWQETLKTLLANAKGEDEIKQVQTYVEKTQKIIRVLNQPFDKLAQQQEALEQAVKEFDETIKPLSEKDEAFLKGLRFSVIIMLSIALAITMALFFTVAPFALLLILPISLGTALVTDRITHEIFEADLPGPISNALSQLGIFHYVPYKKTALTFSSEVSDPNISNIPASEQNSIETPVLTPVYIASKPQ